MWMMGYNDGGDIQDSFNTRRLRNLMPRSAPIASSSTMNPSACLIHATDLLALNHQYLAMAEQNKRESNPQQVVVSSRWNPTPEQLQTLEELYRRGTRTPSAEQIQHITAQLRRYGKIEGKNVFYWFQNHKARERQKRRRQVDEQQPPADDNNNINPKALTGENRTAHEVEQTNNWASSTNSSTVAPQKTVSTQEGAKVSDIAECKADGWLQFEDEAELLQRGKNATWRMTRLSCSSSTTPTINRIINSSSSPPTLTTSTTTAANTIPSTNAPEDLNHSAQTLELFPLMSGTQHHSNDECYCADDEDEAINMNSATITPYPYFEFLPLKN